MVRLICGLCLGAHPLRFSGGISYTRCWLLMGDSTRTDTIFWVSWCRFGLNKMRILELLVFVLCNARFGLTVKTVLSGKQRSLNWLREQVEEGITLKRWAQRCMAAMGTRSAVMLNRWQWWSWCPWGFVEPCRGGSERSVDPTKKPASEQSMHDQNVGAED